MTILLGVLLDVFIFSVLFGPSHFTLDLKAHEEQHCEVDFNIPKENWVYSYTDEAPMICSKAVGGVAEGCVIVSEGTCTIVLPKSYEGIQQ